MNPNEQLKTQLEMLKQQVEALSSEFHANNFVGSQDVNKYTRYNYRLKVPVVTALATSCEIGEVCSYSAKLYHCSAANTWTAQT